MTHENEAIRLIPLFPLAAVVVSGLWLLFARGSMSRGAVIAIGCGAPILSFLVSLREVFQLTRLDEGQRFFVDNLYTWISADPFHAELSFLLDPLSAVMILVVTGVGSLIHIYSVGYMDDDHREDRGFQRFFLYLNLFTFSMLMLVLGDNLLVMFVGWEGVGLCSYLLIGFWYLEDHNAMCGQKAFLVNRIGDFGFLLGIFLLFWAFASVGSPTVEFHEMSANVGKLADTMVTLPPALSFLPAFPAWKLLTLACLCLFVGACGKSAQLPLYTWLPDAMAGPTPVSALIHAATMVTAGVYMVCRMSFAFSLAPGASATVAWVGGLTAVFAATIALTQKDIKKVLAYSTVSQLGYMFLAAGSMAYSAAVYHLATHAFFKALLFLGAGSVILGMHHEQDIDKMGGLRRRMRWTHRWFLCGVLAIAGVPFLSGFFSKDEVLLGAFAAHDLPGHMALYAIGVLTAGLTAFYMLRLHYRVFAGETRATPEVYNAVHESNRWVLMPLAVLAALSVGVWLLSPPDLWGELLFGGMRKSHSLHYFLQEAAFSAPHDVSHATELGLAALATLFALAGIAAASFLYYFKPEMVDRLTDRVRPVYDVLWNKYWVDEIYDFLIVRPLLWVSENVLYRLVDADLIDRIGVNGTARAVRGVANRGLKFLQTGFTQSYLVIMLIGALGIIAYMMRGAS
ncbi:MAG: NADH-quinone oxidoreductase subunit L [Deltaproteobacteria bacterium]|nr:NADH-quinone oxidoreductase subunit L [Deltaproteobacteria bacterium]